MAESLSYFFIKLERLSLEFFVDVWFSLSLISPVSAHW